jgi:hypothetical protein
MIALHYDASYLSWAEHDILIRVQTYKHPPLPRHLLTDTPSAPWTFGL